jgi:hypothetical protein
MGPDGRRSNGDPPPGFDLSGLAAGVQRAQAVGFAAATEVAATMLPHLYADPPAPGTAPPSELLRELLTRGDQLADGVASMVRGVVGPLAEYLEGWLTARTGSDERGRGVELVGSPGQAATATTTVIAAHPTGTGRVWATALSHPDGGDVAGVQCVPNEFDRLAAGTSLPVRITVDIPLEAAPGDYFGLLFCSASSGEARLVRLEVRSEP